MSRSRKLPIIKDRPRNYKKSTFYWRIVRRVQKSLLKSGKEIKNPKEIIDDYNYSDYTIDYRKFYSWWFNGKDPEYFRNKAKRK